MSKVARLAYASASVLPYIYKGKRLAPNQFGAIFLQPIMGQLKIPSMCSYNHMIFLMNHVSCLNNTHE